MTPPEREETGSDTRTGTLETLSIGHRLRVRYAECDPMGLAHHASYIPWLEEARTELLRRTGVTYAELEARGVFMVITKLDVNFRRPVRYDDVVEIAVSHRPMGRVRIAHDYELRVIERAGRPADPTADATLPYDRVCAVAKTQLACVDRAGRPTPLPPWLVVRELAAPD